MTEHQKPARVTFQARIERIFEHCADTRSLFLRVDGRERLSLVPGQFISISIPLEDETRTRAYSIASDPQDELVEICFDRVPNGRGSQWLFDRRIGDSVEFTGPFGAFTMPSAPERETVFICAETAIAPIRPMLHLACAGPHPKLSLLLAARDLEHRPYFQEIESLANRVEGFGLTTIFPSEAGDLYQWILEVAQDTWIEADDNRARNFYICGVGYGVIAIRDLLRGAGYERRAVKYERW
jgi:ferredoxin-NADP reductase